MGLAVVRFPGSNCDRDMVVALESLTGTRPDIIWHDETQFADSIDFIALPGGFSYGDYLRCGAMAARSAIMPELLRLAKKGVPILGVCNGFQILTEARLLPGALMRNANLDFVCRDVTLRVDANSSDLLKNLDDTADYIIPVAHHDGNYFADSDTLDRLENDSRVAFRYKDNPNGSVRNIAGVVSENRKIIGMMPHPERAVDPLCGSSHGRLIMESILESLSVAA
ncbi:phosphoribosylformylglycinamidine synthase subunit PurQ [Parasphingorhabdus sp. DH2-15]|uniref:phosphoribosylformylglycinamidine synthase subunit PurQ n=1 Tax=Parasphingorhabdus sp. DH2-15 TaxID=3444112 RepID=UPI003F686081